ncbi:unnamed protein product [Caenorhabditis bovis]|uniref:Major facilitator superfamily (MFS) profile domain-containing protein n=1 Tax=Caenorhabditis bovis TaxID=2654633 RepID=A0A8S1EU15_9PELO|nr:unnamed protein product [Caenorhabditis bovis]
MDDSQSGMLQTVFISFYMIFAPVFGYLGDRYNRKFMMIFGIVIWIIAVILSTFCAPGHYYLFLLCRGIVGIGEASYSTVAPTIIGDLFVGAARTKVLMLFSIAVPVGSGLGFICGSTIALITDSWQWGVRFSPILGILCIIAMIFFLDEPARGANEGSQQPGDDATLWEDITYICSIPSYVLVTLSIIAAFFTIGTLSWWTPKFIRFAYTIAMKKDPTKAEVNYINLTFGIITCMSGLLGVTMGTLMARSWRDGKGLFKNCKTDNADVLVCAIGMLVSLPFFFAALMLAIINVNACIFIAILCMCWTWAINVDIVMSIVIPNRRATALAIQSLVSHLFGDASAPYITGMFSDWVRGNNESVYGHFYSLKTALYIPTFMIVISGSLYLATSFFITSDRKEALFLMNAVDPNAQNLPEDQSNLVRPESPDSTVFDNNDDDDDDIREIEFEPTDDDDGIPTIDSRRLSAGLDLLPPVISWRLEDEAFPISRSATNVNSSAIYQNLASLRDAESSSDEYESVGDSPRYWLPRA